MLLVEQTEHDVVGHPGDGVTTKPRSWVKMRFFEMRLVLAREAPLWTLFGLGGAFWVYRLAAQTRDQHRDLQKAESDLADTTVQVNMLNGIAD